MRPGAWQTSVRISESLRKHVHLAMMLLRSNASLLRNCGSARRATTTTLPCSNSVSKRSMRVLASATLVGEDLKAQLKAQKKALKEQKKAAEMKEGSMSKSHEEDEHEKKEKKDKKKDKEEKMQKEEKKAKMHMDTEEEQAKLEKKAQKAERKRLCMEAEARGALYSLHWSVAPSKAAAMPAPAVVPAPAAVPAGAAAPEAAPCAATDEAMQFLSSIRMDLEKCEKVAKDAVWFVTKEAAEGATHMVLVTAKAKTAMKYGLEELPQDAEKYMLSLGASVGEVEIPVASLRAMVLAEREQDSDSDSDEEEGGMGMGKAKATAGMQAQGDVRVEGGVDAATAAALAFAEMADKAESGGDMQYPPMRSFL